MLKIVAQLLALLVLMSTVSWTVDKHFCMGQVMDIAFFHTAEDCGMEDSSQLPEFEEYRSHCCTNESLTLSGQDRLQKSSWEELDFQQRRILQALAFSLLVSFKSAWKREVGGFQNPTPLTKEDIHIFYQVFLI